MTQKNNEIKKAKIAERGGRIRLDIWLWAARFYKTRKLATDSVKGGKVTVNHVKAKASKLVNIGDIIEVSQDDYLKEVEILGLNEKRRPYEEAKLLYEESEESKARKDEAYAAKEATPPILHRAKGLGRPTKKDRRSIKQYVIDRLRSNQSD